MDDMMKYFASRQASLEARVQNLERFRNGVMLCLFAGGYIYLKRHAKKKDISETDAKEGE